ncbi:MAG: hypothetical protein II885_03145 [Oscillospiraceae bacterium]|nr:hypothetical protein [Oscillospiraceae bacterium]
MAVRVFVFSFCRSGAQFHGAAPSQAQDNTTEIGTSLPEKAGWRRLRISGQNGKLSAVGLSLAFPLSLFNARFFRKVAINSDKCADKTESADNGADNRLSPVKKPAIKP